MSIVVQGEQAILSVYRSGVAIPVSCENSFSVEENTQEIEITTYGSGVNRDYLAGLVDRSVSLEGLVTFDETSKWQFHEFVQAPRVKQRIKLDWIDDIGNELTLDMYVIVTHWDNNNPTGDFSAFNVTMRVCGAVTITFNGSTGGGTFGIGTMTIGSTFIVS